MTTHISSPAAAATIRADIRLALVGGVISFRALFGWISPWVYIPAFVVGPIFQTIFFTLAGRAASAQEAIFYVLGNSIQYLAIPCIFGMGATVGEERYTRTLGLLLTSPARRVPLFLGRTLPVLLNGLIISIFGMFCSMIIFRLSATVEIWFTIVVAMIAASYACTGLGLMVAAIGLRVREAVVMSNLLYGILLILTGANVPIEQLPGLLRAISYMLPTTHAILASRLAAAGGSVSQILVEIMLEIIIGTIYLALGLTTLRWLEQQSRRMATLDIL